MPITSESAATKLREAALNVDASPLKVEWLEKIKLFSEMCETSGFRTHIAFLGTSILARSIDEDVNLYAIKPKHAPKGEAGYSARSLCHSVLVPLAAEIGINIGVSGREPLNNQPYFRMNYLGDDTPVHTRGRPSFDFMLSLVKKLQTSSSLEAFAALRCFVAVRREYAGNQVYTDTTSTIHLFEFISAVQTFVGEKSEGGKRAQAVAAGLFDVFAGREHVESGRVNDPSRKHPGDVCVSMHPLSDASNQPPNWIKALEVKDKPVSMADVMLFVEKCTSMGVEECAMLMVSARQPELDIAALRVWADCSNRGLTLFFGWTEFIEQLLFWSSPAKRGLVAPSVQAIQERLILLEAEADTVVRWRDLTTKAEASED